MLRTALCSLATLVFCTGLLLADDKSTEKGGKKLEATITKLDARTKTLTVKMKDTTGKEEEKTFQLTDQVRMLDNDGRAATIDSFRSGNEVVLIERDGKIVEMKKHDKGLAPVPGGRPGSR